MLIQHLCLERSCFLRNLQEHFIQANAKEDLSTSRRGCSRKQLWQVKPDADLKHHLHEVQWCMQHMRTTDERDDCETDAGSGSISSALH